MIGAKRTGIFPLRIGHAIAFADCDPAAFTCANGWTLIGLLEPWDDLGRFRPMTGRGFVVIGQSAIKRILCRYEIRRNVTNTVSAIRVVESTVIPGPIFVPRTRTIWDRIVPARLLTDPENGRHNFLLPWIPFRVPGRFLSRRNKYRSEEHTSELQSRGHLVCRLLLEKK